MAHFLIGLQFLTRISIVWQDHWTAEDFGKSVRYFPLIGAVLGCCYALVAILHSYIAQQGFFPVGDTHYIYAAILTLVPIYFTGGLHMDGFMDTVDGIFSGRDRDKMLTIMKDSRVGANGVTAFVGYILFQWSIFMELAGFSDGAVALAVFFMPIIGRMAMVLVIAVFPYARPQGIGKAFSDYADKKTVFIAGVLTLAILLPWGLRGILPLIFGILVGVFFGHYATRKLGGVTGDVFGAVSNLAELTAVFTYYLLLVFLPMY